MSPIFTLNALIDRFWEEADCSVECVRGQLRDAIDLLERTNRELGFLLHDHRADPNHVPPLGSVMGRLEDALNKSEEDKKLRWLNRQPMGELVGFNKRKSS
jgi:hypothetical protein